MMAERRPDQSINEEYTTTHEKNQDFKEENRPNFYKGGTSHEEGDQGGTVEEGHQERSRSPAEDDQGFRH